MRKVPSTKNQVPSIRQQLPIISVVFFFFFILLLNPVGVLAYERKAVVYYNEACGDCKVYLDKVVKKVLDGFGFESLVFDYINDPSKRKELNDLNQKYAIPLEYQDNMAVFIGEKVILEGHVPEGMVAEAVGNINDLPVSRLLLAQPEMHGEVSEVRIYTFPGAFTVSPTASVLSLLKERVGKKDGVGVDGGKFNFLPAVVFGGLANSVHPCSIAVLLVLLTFLYSIRKSGASIMMMGFLYILGIFIVYFAIGLGIFRAVSISEEPFFVAKTASLIAVSLGLINVKDYFFPKSSVHFKIPDFTKGAIASFLERASLPSSFFLGAVVGICAFPCTGGIYTAVITTLAVQKSMAMVGYLFIYNLFFVLPLILIVLLSANKTVLLKVESLEVKNSRKMHLVSGILMIAVGLFISVWLSRL